MNANTEPKRRFLQDINWNLVGKILFWLVVVAVFIYWGYRWGMGITVSAAIIVSGGYPIIHDAWLKRRVLSPILILAMGVIYILASMYKIQDALLTSDDALYVLAMAAIVVIVVIGWKKGITEIYQIFAYAFILERVMTNHNWLIDVIFGRWIPVITTLATTFVFRP
jgi:hypothetical protein